MPHTHYQTQFRMSSDVWSETTGGLIILVFSPWCLFSRSVLQDHFGTSLFLAQTAMDLTGNGFAGQSRSCNDSPQDSCMEHSAHESCRVAFGLSHLCAHIGATGSFHCSSSQVVPVLTKSSTLLRVGQISGTCMLCYAFLAVPTQIRCWPHRPNKLKELLPRHSESGSEF